MVEQRRGWELEDLFFGGAALVLLLAAAAALELRGHLHLANGRVAYGIFHLPAALGASGLFFGAIVAARALLSRMGSLEGRPTGVFVCGLVVAFAVFWLPVLLTGGFVHDDWMLLAAASVRKSITVHPALSWYALDSVDGNFRPLGTVLYFGWMLRWFGLSPHAFLLGNFVVNLLVIPVLFLIVRELGYSKIAGAAAGLLYLSRGMIYEIVSWVSALGDGIVILLCGLAALLILKANKRGGMAAAGYHVAAWALFLLATFAKQSSFAFPLIVGLLVFMRPGEAVVVQWGRRLAAAVVGVIIYGATASLSFLHGKSLFQHKDPYPIGFSLASVARSFSYLAWYAGGIEIPGKYTVLVVLTRGLGVCLLVLGIVLVKRVPKTLGEQPRDVFFALLAALASISLFVVLGTRIAEYYGAMFAFWLSVAVGIAVTRFGAPHRTNTGGRVACFVFCLLLAAGFTDIRLKQTGLITSGGYTWGTFNGDTERAEERCVRQILAEHPRARLLVLTDLPDAASYFTSMALMDGPQIQRILVHDSSTEQWFSNDLHGERPRDDRAGWRDPLAYNWTEPLAPAEAGRMMVAEPLLELAFHNGEIAVKDSDGSAVR